MESKQRGYLRDIMEEIEGVYKIRFSIYLCTPKDVRDLTGLDEGRGDVGRNMKKGRLLYP